ncbi:hypothetical protein CCAX7_66020 [Capsulimonas corticalis]|uniref:Alpha-L-arabinofuranosidase 1 catalytic domain-containing protein n=1 Tax=Capsulimonas corticalis TaxID=2219043 RepID=A0A402CR75_9BACT|nr:hypothetical protein [Capsulimonas corticalis]BDI34551.1 hypothetical protein CCAX7_66020 [Capsulimonas corticalis]
MPIIVTSQEVTATPISDRLYGHFIELGYGVQVEPMWSEMFFNRSFEPFTPYKWINKEWYDLWLDPKHPEKGYKTDWSQEDWHHSGYEHNPWFAVPGDEGPLEITDESTFILPRSATLDIEIGLTSEGARHGETCLKVVNGESEAWGGFAQAGKVIQKEAGYKFRGFLKSDTPGAHAEVRIYAQGDWAAPLFTAPVGPIGEEWEEFSCTFHNKVYEGRAVFSLWIAPGATVYTDCFSLMPTNTRHGWRPEVVEAAARINPKVIRWPGGCFASFYNWRDGIGPYDQRKPQPSYFWGGQNANDVGTAELATFAKMLGADSMICVNLHHPTKQFYEVYWNDESKGPHGFDFPHFADPAQGAREAADWVAYCNLPVGAHPMADQRAEHGYPEPFGVRFWEMDNESLRWFTPTAYAEAVAAYSQAMKAVDPSIQIGLITYGEEYKKQIPEMLAIAGAHVDFLADRAWGEAQLLAVLEPMRAYNAACGTTIRYCDTEWLAHQDEPDAFNHVASDAWTGETKSYRFSKWRYAMNIFRNFLMWRRQGGDVLFVNFNNFANTHSQCVIDTPKEGAYLTAAGHVFEMISRAPAAWPLALDGYTVDAKADYQVQAEWDLGRERLVLSIVNMAAEPRSETFDLTPLERVFTNAQLSQLAANSLTTMNTLEHPDMIRRLDSERGSVGVSYSLDIPAYSLTQVILAAE